MVEKKICLYFYLNKANHERENLCDCHQKREKERLYCYLFLPWEADYIKCEKCVVQSINEPFSPIKKKGNTKKKKK